jgi:cytochrome P450
MLLGPVVRCNPHELHISDPDFYETIYSASSPRDKAHQHVRWAGNTGAAQATVDHDLHALRRRAQNPYFSKRQILAFVPHIQDAVDKLIARLDEEWKGTNKPVVLSDAFGCFTGDMIMEYCFAQHHDFLSAPEFSSPFLESVHQLESTAHIMMHFPVLIKIMRLVPDFLLPGKAMPIIQFERDMAKQITELIEERNQGYKDASHPTVFRELLDNPELGPVLGEGEKGVKRLQDEGVTLVGAGQETNKVALTIAMFHLLRQPETMKKLYDEILSIFPNPNEPPSLAQLEQLPYLTAVLMESKTYLFLQPLH